MLLSLVLVFKEKWKTNAIQYQTYENILKCDQLSVLILNLPDTKTINN